MKIENINAREFDKIAHNFKKSLRPEVTVHIFKHYVIGNLIDMCHHNGYAMVIDGSIYTVEHGERSGSLWNVLDNIEAETVNEWILRVEKILLP